MALSHDRRCKAILLGGDFDPFQLTSPLHFVEGIVLVGFQIFVAHIDLRILVSWSGGNKRVLGFLRLDELS